MRPMQGALHPMTQVPRPELPDQPLTFRLLPRSLGQNFLTDDGILENIVTSAGVKAGDLVLEVRAG